MGLPKESFGGNAWSGAGGRTVRKLEKVKPGESAGVPSAGSGQAFRLRIPELTRANAALKMTGKNSFAT